MVELSKGFGETWCIPSQLQLLNRYVLSLIYHVIESDFRPIIKLLARRSGRSLRESSVLSIKIINNRA
jgi:hypothetical protein